MKLYYLAAFLAVIAFPPPSRAQSSWNDPTKAQYHIQTDEGPERYFRYQTLSGQYRKEKRLEDGTVIGAYGWVDDDGFLRMRDYIADGAGYRILKTKNVFVGRARPINEALTLAKKAPAEAGTLVSPSASPVVTKTTSTPYYSSPAFSQPSTYNTPANVQVLPVGYSTEQFQSPVFKYATYPLPQTTAPLGYSTQTQPPPTYLGHAPTVEVSLNSIPSSTESPLGLPSVPSSTILPPVGSSTTPAPAVSSTTPPTVYIPSTTASVSTTPRPETYTLPSTSYGSPVVRYASPTPAASTLAPPIAANDLYSGAPQYEHYPEGQRWVNPYIHQNGPTYPIDKNGNTYNGHNNNIGNGYDPQFPFYDGVSVTNDGFRYYIPKQYHEEHDNGQSKTGSFGYIDPFGIRRVIYYNAGPDGFKHRKNNRYVGLDATPYDPRPY